MELIGKEFSQLHSALLDAYPSRDALARMARFNLDVRLEEISTGDDLNQIVFDLITWAERADRLEELITGAHESNRDNALLNTFIKQNENLHTFSRTEKSAGLRLQSIRLTNVKCFDELILSFDEEDGSRRKWTVLLGGNGSGKSTLIKAIALVVSGSEALGELLGEPNQWVRFGQDSCEIVATITVDGSQSLESKLRIKRGDTRTDVIIRNSGNFALLDRALEGSKSTFFVIGFGASRRLSLADSLRQSTSSFDDVRAQSVATLFDPDATLNPIESWAMDLDYRGEQQGFEIVKKVLSDFLPGISFSHIDKRRGQLLFETPDGTVSLRNLSDGYQSVAAWIGDLLFRIMEVSEGDWVEDPLSAGGLLIIDEVDLHLHPKWQRDLLTFMDEQLPNFQILVTTHSVVTAQQAGPEQLHYLERKDGKITCEQFVGNPRNLLLNQLMLTDAFGIETDESLEVQQKKESYRCLSSKNSRTSAEQTELDKLTNELIQLPEGGRSNLKLNEKQTELLETIQRDLRDQTS